MYVPCDYCGKVIYRTQYRLNLHEHHYCSNECQKKKQHDDAYEIRMCEVCGSEFKCAKISEQRFCSIQCQHEWQKTRTGFNNPRFTQQYTTCDYCGKKYLIHKHKVKNSKNHFCSVECRQKWYSEVFSQREEWKQESRERALRMLADGAFGTNTSIQIKINNLLDDMSIRYENETQFSKWSVDNYLTDYNLVIENNGDYWHCNRNKYKTINYLTQYNRVINDIDKLLYLENKHGINVLYLWESDINNNIDLCRELIYEFIHKQGNIPNRNSFNYVLNNNELVATNDIITPYQEMSVNEIEQYVNFQIAG